MPVLYGCSNLVTLPSKVFLLHVSFIPISSIFFNFLLQLLLTDRNPQTFHPLSVLVLIPDVDQLFITLGDIRFRPFVSSTPASLSRSRPTQSTIAGFCRHQSPGSAYHAADCRLLVAELLRSPARRLGMTSLKT